MSIARGFPQSAKRPGMGRSRVGQCGSYFLLSSRAMRHFVARVQFQILWPSHSTHVRPQTHCQGELVRRPSMLMLLMTCPGNSRDLAKLQPESVYGNFSFALSAYIVSINEAVKHICLCLIKSPACFLSERS